MLVVIQAPIVDLRQVGAKRGQWIGQDALTTTLQFDTEVDVTFADS